MSDTWYWRGFDNGKAESRAEIAALKALAEKYETEWGKCSAFANRVIGEKDAEIAALRHVLQRRGKSALPEIAALREENARLMADGLEANRELAKQARADAAEIAALKALVESAYREGWRQGASGECSDSATEWRRSKASKALRGEGE
jgi:hypothetical protein